MVAQNGKYGMFSLLSLATRIARLASEVKGCCPRTRPSPHRAWPCPGCRGWHSLSSLGPKPKTAPILHCLEEVQYRCETPSFAPRVSHSQSFAPPQVPHQQGHQSRVPHQHRCALSHRTPLMNLSQSINQLWSTRVVQ